MWVTEPPKPPDWPDWPGFEAVSVMQQDVFSHNILLHADNIKQVNFIHTVYIKKK